MAEEDGGNIRAPGERRTFLAGLAAFGRDFAVRTFQGAVGVAVLFVPFGVVAAMVAWDASFLLGIPLIGAFIGLLINGGSTFEAWFSEARPSGETSAEAAPDGMLHAWARMFQPRSVTLLQGLHGLLTHDYSQGRPGRWKRAAVGGSRGPSSACSSGGVCPARCRGSSPRLPRNSASSCSPPRPAWSSGCYRIRSERGWGLMLLEAFRIRS